MSGTEVILAGESYAILGMSTQDLQETIAENVGNGTLSPGDFDKVKVPSGGGTTWEIPSIDGIENSKAIEGIVVAWKDQRAYWKESFEETGGGTPPDCYSDDMFMGVGEPGGSCAECPFSQFGSANKGEGKACKEIRTLLIIREGDILPIVLDLPPTSIQPVKRAFLRLVSKGLKFYDVVFRFELVKAKNKGGITYAEVKPSIVGRVPQEKRPAIRSYVESIKPVLHEVHAVDITSDVVAETTEG